jgi:gluconate kinase
MSVSGCGTSAVRAAHRPVTFLRFSGSRELTTAGMTGRAGHFMPLPPATT